jgi:Pin2-interacting protein X1
MGLSQPKNKQKIGIDPQNKRWKDDKEKIGFKLLSKMGWKEGNGLGAKQDGMQSNIKVTLKENKFGIGANARTSDSWLENSFAFDNLLKGIEETADPTVFKMPDEPSAEKVISSNRYA